MSIASYSELKTAVGNWLNRDDLTTYLADLVMLGEKKVYRDLRIRAMETALSSTIASGVIALPSDYVELKSAYVDGSPTQILQRKTAEFLYTNYPTRSSDGKPKFIGREVSNFIFGPYPDSTYTIKGVYYARLTALSDSNTTNWFTTNAPDILLFASLLEAEIFIKNDERIALWQAKYDQIASQLTAEDQREQFSGSTLRMTASWN